MLIEYLKRDDVVSDPILKLAEEAVQRTAALALAAWHIDEVFDVLLILTIKRPIAGVIEALGAFERHEAVPVLLYTLEDDFCRTWAEDALARTAARDRDLLMRSALLALPGEEEESESSLRRRRALLRLLRDVPLTPDECRRLAALINSSDVDVAVGAAAVAVFHGNQADQQQARHRLCAIAPPAPWHLHDDVQSLLERPTASREGHPDENPRSF